jgi:DNA-binding response OmpR family regulator/tetratricopeptide (TPR) repeat protein
VQPDVQGKGRTRLLDRAFPQRPGTDLGLAEKAKATMEKRVLLLTPRTGLGEKLRLMLGEQGLLVQPCHEARHAVEETLHFQPDLIVCDDDLPVLSGRELARLFKAHERLAGIPFVLLSSRLPPLAEMERGGYRISADDLIQLPIEKEDLAAQIGAWLRGERRLRPPVDLTDAPLAPYEPAGAGQPWRQGKLSPVSLTRLLLHLARNRETGVLRLKGQRRKLKALVQSGSVVEVETNYLRDDSFGRFLQQIGRVTERQSDDSFALATQKRITQAQALADMGVLPPHEVDRCLAEQKIHQLTQAFSPAWRGAAFHFASQGLESRSFALDPTPLVEILKRGVFGAADALDLRQTLLRAKGAGQPARLAESFSQVAQELRLDADLYELARTLEGAAVDQLDSAEAPAGDRPLRLAFLLAACGGLQFAETAAPPESRQAEAAPEGAAPAGWDADAYRSGVASARTLFNREDFRGAQIFLDRALAANPESSECLAMKAWCMYELSGKQDIAVAYEAKELLKRAITLDDNNDEAFVLLGRIFKAEGKDSLAGVHFRRASEINPANEAARREVKLLQVKRRRSREGSGR